MSEDKSEKPELTPLSPEEAKTNEGLRKVAEEQGNALIGIDQAGFIKDKDHSPVPTVEVAGTPANRAAEKIGLEIKPSQKNTNPGLVNPVTPNK